MNLINKYVVVSLKDCFLYVYNTVNWWHYQKKTLNHMNRKEQYDVSLKYMYIYAAFIKQVSLNVLNFDDVCPLPHPPKKF